MDFFVNYMNNNNNIYGIKILIEKELIFIQKELCKILNNCYVYIYNQDNCYLIYNKKIFGIIKQNNHNYFIWKIK